MGQMKQKAERPKDYYLQGEQMNWDVFPGKPNSLARRTSIKEWWSLLNESLGDPPLACRLSGNSRVDYEIFVSHPELAWDVFWENLRLRGKL
tara:strand:+ start:225 stop:500 length:276 start_codon:yes stop_codon:yes gene_type:complete